MRVTLLASLLPALWLAVAGGCSNDFKAASGAQNYMKPEKKAGPSDKGGKDGKNGKDGPNGIPDGLEDTNKNGIPDGEEDRDGNGKPDGKEDKNGNGIPDGEEDRGGSAVGNADGSDGGGDASGGKITKDEDEQEGKPGKKSGKTGKTGSKGDVSGGKGNTGGGNPDDLDSAGGELGATAKGGDIETDDATVTGQMAGKTSINFEDIPVDNRKSDHDFNDGNLCFDEAEPVFKVDTVKRTIRVVKDAPGIVARMFRGACNRNTLVIRIKRKSGGTDTIGPLDPGKQRTVTLDLRKGDDINVDLLVKGDRGNVFSTDDGTEQAKVTAGFCQLEGATCH